MSDKLEKTVFLAELDALLDTRASILTSELGAENIYKFISGGYYNRWADRFNGMDWRTFRARYAKRTAADLNGTLPTPVLTMIREFVKGVLENIVSSPNHLDPEIYINIHPYELSASVKKQIAQMVEVKTGSFAEVTIIDKPYSDITPKWMKANDISYFAIYDYTEWLNIHFSNGNLSETRLPTVGLIAPRIIVTDPSGVYIPDLETSFDITKDRVDPYINLSYSPILDFCADIPQMLMDKLEQR